MHTYSTRRKTSRARRRSIILLAGAAALIVPGCGKLTPNGEVTAFALLQQGSPKVCVAPEVQGLLRDMLTPKTGDIGGGDAAQKQAGIRSVSFAFDTTTLQSADKAVSKAQCQTNVKVTGFEGATRTFPLPFQVLPAAEGDGRIVVTALTEPAKAYAVELAQSHAEDAIATNYNAEQDARIAAERAKLLATVNPKWLVGTWIAPGQSSEACSIGEGFVFNADRSAELSGQTVRWSLTEGVLHVVGSGIDRSMMMSEADGISFTASDDESTWHARRCSRDEVEATMVDAHEPGEAEQ